MLIAFDLDGVLCDIDLGLVELLFAMDGEAKKRAEAAYYRSRKPELNARMFLHPDDIPIIITARVGWLKPITEAWMRQYYNGWHIYYSEDLQGNGHLTGLPWAKRVAIQKAKIVSDLAVDFYIDDNPDVVHEMRILLPGKAILQYGGRITGEVT
jgi:hypothetical protein